MSAPSRSRSRRPTSTSSAAASRRRGGQARSSSATGRRACSSATLQALARYWTTEHDWRKAEARLNALPQFTTEIDGVGDPLHPREVAARECPAADHDPRLARLGHGAARHGRPADRSDRARRTAEDAFHLVLPSMPGYGFSGEPTEVGWDPGRVGRAWAELMHRLGYTRYVAQGGDVGAIVTDMMGRQAPEGLAGIHTNLLVTGLAAATTRRTPTRNARPSRRSPPSGRAVSATSWNRPRGRRRSATPCWIHPSPWRAGCSTTTRTATRRSPARSSAGSRRATSPATTSSTTSRCTG